MECLICQNVVQNESLNFWGVTICGDCEGLLMELALEQPEYDHFVQAFRLLWQRQLLALSDLYPMDGDPV